MLKLLLKKQMAEVWRGYFYDAKKNKARSKTATILMFVFYFFLMVGLLGGMFAFLSFTLCAPLAEVHMNWLFFALMGLLSLLLGLFGSVFNTYSSLYRAKDNDFLLSLPIPVRYIMMSRLLNVYLLGLMYSGVVIVPAILVSLIVNGFTVLSLIGGLILFLVISVLGLIFSCILGWVVAKISLKLKNKSFATVFISLVFIGGYYFFYFKAQDLLREIVLNAQYYGDKVRGSAYILYFIGKCGSGDPIAIIVCLLVSAVLLILTYKFMSRNFLKLATSTGAISRKEYREKAVKVKGVHSALFSRELSRFISSPNYMLNCGLGILLIPVVGILLLIKGSYAVNVLTEVFGERTGCVPVLILTGICALIAMCDIAAPSVSLEGKNLWLAQSLPITPWQVLRSKASLQIVLAGIPTLFCVICALAILPGSVVTKLLIVLFSVSYVIFAALFNLTIGLKMCILNWTSEIKPIKQSAAVTIALFGGWVFSVIFAGLYIFFGWHLGVTVYLVIATAVILAVSLVLYHWLKNGGARTFSDL